jgi:Tol biopolymer transport system component
MEVAMVGEAYEIAWSPVDDRVAITGTDTTRAFGIRVLRPGSAERRDYLVGQVGAYVEWSRDGRIIYQMNGNQRFGLLDPATGRDSMLAMPDGVGWAFNPRISPDGRTLAWRWSRESDPGLYVGPLGGPGMRMIVPGDVRPLRWSPDGTRLWAAERPVGDNRERLIAVAFPAGTLTRFGTLPADFLLNDLTPDGRTMVVTRRERESDAWLIELP